MGARMSYSVSGGGVRIEVMADEQLKASVHSQDYPHDATIQLTEADARELRGVLDYWLEHRAAPGN